MPSNNNDVIVVSQFESLATAAKNYALDLFSQNGGGSAITPAVFTGATSNTGGASGIVPAPQAGDDDKFLCGNGQWVTLQSGGTNFVPGTGLTMVGDTLNCTVGSSIILSTVASSVPGAMWLVY